MILLLEVLYVSYNWGIYLEICNKKLGVYVGISLTTYLILKTLIIIAPVPLPLFVARLLNPTFFFASFSGVFTLTFTSATNFSLWWISSGPALLSTGCYCSLNVELEIEISFFLNLHEMPFTQDKYRNGKKNKSVLLCKQFKIK